MIKRVTARNILYVQIICYVVIISYSFLPLTSMVEWLSSLIIAVSGYFAMLLVVLGPVLALLAQKETGKLKLFMTLAGLSIVLPVPFVLSELFIEPSMWLFYIVGASEVLATFLFPLFAALSIIVIVRERH